MKTQKALKLALEALEKSHLHPLLPDDCEKTITAIREALAEQPAPPPECKTDAEKTAFAFGWWKALEENRKQPAQQDSTCNKTLRDQGKAYPRTCKKCGLGPCIADQVQPEQQAGHTFYDGNGNVVAHLDATSEITMDYSKPSAWAKAAQQDPVAWITKNGKGWLRWHKPEDSEKNKDSIPLYTSPPAQRQGPVAWKNAAIRLGEELSSVGPDGYYDMTAEQWLDWAMDQHPQGKNSLPAQRKPLTDGRISWLWSDAHNDTTDRMPFQVFARAIEAAHGIKGDA